MFGAVHCDHFVECYTRKYKVDFRRNEHEMSHGSMQLLCAYYHKDLLVPNKTNLYGPQKTSSGKYVYVCSGSTGSNILYDEIFKAYNTNVQVHVMAPTMLPAEFWRLACLQQETYWFPPMNARYYNASFYNFGVTKREASVINPLITIRKKSLPHTDADVFDFVQGAS